MCKVGQDHIYNMAFWQKNHQVYGHKRCNYMVLVNRTDVGRRTCTREKPKGVDHKLPSGMREGS